MVVKNDFSERPGLVKSQSCLLELTEYKSPHAVVDTKSSPCY